jgi:uncharacterized coiled-coil protein SlyX
MKHQNRILISIFIGLMCLPASRAVSPPPDGGYPGGNTAEGQSALFSLTTGIDNTAVGFSSLLSVTDGEFNTAIGAGALLANISSLNTATGAGALLDNTTGADNTATGSFALLNNTTGTFNTATGASALFSNTEGVRNTANGETALLFNTTGSENTATGNAALVENIDGSFNTANGLDALHDNTHGDDNTADGIGALEHNATGNNNTAVGSDALSGITSGNSNTVVGKNAGANLTSSDSNNIDIGFDVHGVSGESNTIRIGNDDITDTFCRGISGATVAGGAAVFVASNGHMGTTTSSARFKEGIKPMGNASEAILALRPVSFRYKKQIDPQGIPEFGLIAEEVEKVNPDLVIRDPEGKPYTVRYDQVNAMLLNEFLKEHKKVAEQQATIIELTSTVARQQKNFARQDAAIKALTFDLQKVSARVEMNKSATRVVLNDP